ncbi:hypothetical protein GCM10010413_15150 [Promicromonospora sukumoe]|uniref:Uncharacterized protein n=1 Tax=Promicromonospora sukumoe TaxID=88382 RepID=A0A7W3JAL4_9MICO|nr:hypothetical protein [Promicromonospora sukumoe]MBA8809259.1 hypothetical protein [Promicromonospora sukumoe]
MEAARDERTGAIVSVDVYGRLGPDERSRLQLVCDGSVPSGAACAGAAHYRRRSVDGRRPCFYNTAHSDGCSSASIASDDAEGDEGRDAQVLTASAGLITLRVDPPRPSTGPDQRRRPDDDVPGATSVRHVLRPAWAVVGEGATTRRLRTVLSALLAGKLDPEVMVAVEETAPMLAAVFFVHMTSTDPARSAGQTRGYWGRVRRVESNVSTGSFMLYADGVRDPSLKVVVTKQQAAALGLDEDQRATLIGAYMLAVGRYQVSRANNPYIMLPSPWHLGMVKPSKGSA